MLQILNCSQSMNVLIGAVKFILNLIRWLIPVVLIILGSIDMFKAMASNDEKKAGEAKKTFIRRLIYAVVAFLIPFIVTFAFDIVGQIITDNNPNTNDIHNTNLTNGNFFECWYNGGSSSNNYADNGEYENSSNEKHCYKLVERGHMEQFDNYSSSQCSGSNLCYGTVQDCYSKLLGD